MFPNSNKNSKDGEKFDETSDNDIHSFKSSDSNDFDEYQQELIKQLNEPVASGSFPLYQLKYIITGLITITILLVSLSYYLLSDRKVTQDPQQIEIDLPEESTQFQKSELLNADPSLTKPIENSSSMQIDESNIKRIPLTFVEEDKIPPIDLTEKSSQASLDEKEPINEEQTVNEDQAIKEDQSNVIATEKITEHNSFDLDFDHSKKINISSKSEKILINKINPAIIIGSDSRQWIDISGENFNPEQSVYLKWSDGKNGTKEKTFSKTINYSQLKYVNSELIRIHINTGRKATKWSIQIKDGDRTSNTIAFETISPYEQKKDNSKQVPKKTERKNKLLANTGEKITIQLLGSSDENKINKIIEDHKDIKSLEVIKVNNKQNDWYVLLYGVFNNKNEAKKAFLKLPVKLQYPSHWIRSIESLKTQYNSESSRSKTRETKNTSTEKSVKNEPGKWTIQLINLSSKAKAWSYIKRHKLGSQAKYYIKESNGTKIYSITYGRFSSRDLAQKALNNLSTDVKRSKPWIINLSEN